MRKLLLLAAIAATFTACQPGLESKEEKTPEFVTQYFVNKEGKKEGVQTKADAKTKAIVQESMYKNGEQDGEDKFFFPSGKVEELHNYKAGIQEGLSQTFYESGVLRSEVLFVKGAMQGLFKKFYENKQLKESVTFVDNFEAGAFKEFYQDGKPKAEGNYKYNTKFEEAMEDGALTLYDSLGVKTQKMCENGRCVTVGSDERLLKK
jgi:antitoxin component YwqK of YwqJK toxin-antitoxin module